MIIEKIKGIRNKEAKAIAEALKSGSTITETTQKENIAAIQSLHFHHRTEEGSQKVVYKEDVLPMTGLTNPDTSDSSN